ncbi:hypothetical protein DU508_18325 [Pedobacter chinensis]|uniref:Uncharacterized protein n=1 Tax=Pedobacter chinensis TaxID=2282421 RepID=A0A369PYE4_9SPHI|nr:hypothetical protein DU508_18325 [Pedobacter chinensis]
MYQFFLCKANIIDWKVKPKSILFTPFFQGNVRNWFMATSAPLSLQSLIYRVDNFLSVRY